MQVDGFKVGDVVQAEVIKIHSFGAIVKLPNNSRGLIHISQVADDYVENVGDYLKKGDKVTARIKKMGSDGKIDLTLKKRRKVLMPAYKTKGFKTSPFQEKIDEFLKKTKNNTAENLDNPK